MAAAAGGVGDGGGVGGGVGGDGGGVGGVGDGGGVGGDGVGGGGGGALLTKRSHIDLTARIRFACFNTFTHALIVRMAFLKYRQRKFCAFGSSADQLEAAITTWLAGKFAAQPQHPVAALAGKPCCGQRFVR